MKPRRLVCCLALALVRISATGASLPRGIPESEGVPAPAVAAFVDAVEAKIDAVHSFMLVRHGKVVAEGWWSPYTADRPHVLNSLTKSFTSTAVGLAVSEGKLSIDDPVLKFFPNEAPARPGEALKQMRVRDLLTMTTGHTKEEIDRFFWQINVPFLPEPNLPRRFFAMTIAHPPGTQFEYDSAASHMLSIIVRRATGQTIEEYLTPRLFKPLGIEIGAWQKTGDGTPIGGFGLHLRTEDIAKFGQLYLRKGNWNGQQLIPTAWVEAATRKQVENRKDPKDDSDWAQGYGYQFWQCRHGFYRGDGALGQFCIVMPRYDAVMAITSGTKDMAGVMSLVWDIIVPAFHDGPLPPDPAADAKLKDRTRHLQLRHDNGLGTN